MIFAKYIDKLGNDLSVVNAARISFDNVKTSLDEKDIKLINYLAKNKHFSPFEHCSLTVLVECPIYISKQIIRHRTFSFNEVSRRYTSENLKFYVPQFNNIRKQAISNKQGSDGLIEEEKSYAAIELMNTMHKDALTCYNFLVNDLGIAREQARGVLPQNLMTKFLMTGNLRNWVHFINLRIDNHAQQEVQIIAKDVKNLLLEHFSVSTKALLEYK